MSNAERLLAGILAQAGLTINGPELCDPQVHDSRFFPQTLWRQNLGMGESYMEGWWDCHALDEFFRKLLIKGIGSQMPPSLNRLTRLGTKLTNRQTLRRSRRVARTHYNLDNDLFTSFLDPHLQYSCAVFENGCTLEQAQENKLRMILDKLGLQPGDRLLDIGSGWGGLARYAASTRGARVTGVNIAEEQVAFARNLCAGLDVEFLQQDYRELRGEYDKIVSVGMFEHVGRKNHRRFFQTCDRCLTPDGRLLLHTIGSNVPTAQCDPWIDKYIFPGGQLPTVADIGRAAEGLFVMEDWHNLGPHYAETLAHWHANFQQAWHREDTGLAERYDERFKRMWEYYLQSCRGAFLARDIQVWQIVFTRPGSQQPCCRV